jgi:16S rRNA (cytosine967-C5)-methyltransferase
MTPSARIKAVLEILERIHESRIPMDKAMGDYLRFRKYIGSKDRAFIAEATYVIYRHYGRLAWQLKEINQEISPRNLLLAYVYQFESPIEKYFDDTKYAADPLQDSEIEFLKILPALDTAPISVQVECPDQYKESLIQYFGENFETEMKAFLDSASLVIRVNTHLAEVEKVQKYLTDDGVPTSVGEYVPESLRVPSKTFLSKTRAFVKGWIDIQDEGSQMIALACNVKPSMQVLDYCAGAGGKTLALANRMKVKGRIVAMDTEAARLEKGRDRFKRARVSDIIEVRPLSDEKHRKWLKRQKETFDVVLTDVPCTGTGTWRRNPDMRWKLYGPSLAELLPIQADILDRVVHTVKLGGRIVYATCSILPEENEQQVEAFLKRHPDFKLMPLSEAWPEGLKLPEGCNDFMRLTPHRHATDGFFAAVFQRIKSNLKEGIKTDDDE